MSKVTSASNEGPFSGTWEQTCVGWGSGYTAPGGLLETFGSVDTAPTPLNAIGNMARISMSGYFSASPVVIATGSAGADQGSLGTFTITPPGGSPLTFHGASVAHFANCNDTGVPFSGGVATWIWESQAAGAEFVNGEVTIVDIVVGPVLQGQAAGNAGSDVLLTWTALNCNDTQFEIQQNGTTVATIPAINQGNNVYNSPSSDFNYGYAIAQLTPNTDYTFDIVGDANGSSNVVSVTTGCRGVEIFNCDCSIEPVYQTLAALRSRVMIRLGYPNQAANPPPGMTALVNAFLYDAQMLIWKQLSRAGLNVERFFRWVMVPGQRYYGITSNSDTCALTLDPYKITWAGFEDLNRAWYRLTEGIPPEAYTRANINFGWPTNYEIRSCIEIFPAPQAPYTLWIKGDMGLASFVNDSDTATIDDQAVFLLALGSAKLHYGQQDGQAIMTQASTYIHGLVAGLHGTRRYVPKSSIQRPATPPRFLPLGDNQA